ncbi:alkaline phosphatase family protein [Enterococcus timonensis]|uniref:alkaline phosphatase family protein n=1 Tax=Enterococcus timonensis TaxID=1852364 RepID=UPI0009F58706|nr:alkaline phosphatase family protein [Enterococcus timonensis]
MLILIFIFFALLLITYKRSKYRTTRSAIFRSLWLVILTTVATLFGTRLVHGTILPNFLFWQTWVKSPRWSLLIFVLLAGFILGGIILFTWNQILGKIHLKKITFFDGFFLSLTILLIFIGFLIPLSSYWGMDHFSNLAIDQIVYHLTEPLQGSDASQIYAFIELPFLTALFATFLAGEIIYQMLAFSHKKVAIPTLRKKPKRHPALRKFFLLLSGIIILLAGFTLGLSRIGFAEVRAYFFESSTLYEDEYVDPRTTEIVFPEQKRNLIYIFLESMEGTYYSTDLGGGQEENLLPNMADLSENGGTNFSNSNLLGGALQVPGVGFTAGGMVAQTAGIPLITTVNGNDYGNTSSYLPGAYSLGEILAEAGYNQTLLLGSEASFGGRDKYFTQHGNYNIVDYNSAIENEWIPEDYLIWWGYEDAKLFEFAKNTITEMSTGTQPFNFTMITADTHFEDGLVTDQTPIIYDDQYSNVIHYSDQMVYELLTWIMEQPFYENTTIVLAGDHLSMDKDFFDNLPTDYERNVFNLFLNSAVSTDNIKNRQFSTLDLYPTTLAALGAVIPGDRLALGTNLFSETPTLMEEYGFDNLYSQMAMGSKYYSQKIMKNSEAEVVNTLDDSGTSE